MAYKGTTEWDLHLHNVQGMFLISILHERTHYRVRPVLLLCVLSLVTHLAVTNNKTLINYWALTRSWHVELHCMSLGPRFCGNVSHSSKESSFSNWMSPISIWIRASSCRVLGEESSTCCNHWTPPASTCVWSSSCKILEHESPPRCNKQ